MEPEMVAKLQELIDRVEIEKCLTRIARGMDRHDAELAKSGYWPDAWDSHVMWVARAGEVIDRMEIGHDTNLRGHQHYITNMTIDIDGDVAHVETYNIMAGVAKDSWETIIGGGRYIDRLEKRDGVWLVADRVGTAEWWNPAQWMERLAPLVQGPAQDRTDISYTRPLRIERVRRELDESILTDASSSSNETGP